MVVNMWCEEGHTFDYKLTFHKGKTLVNFQRLGDFDASAERRPDELWRD